MYGTTPRPVVLHLSPGDTCLAGDRAELVARLEAERIPNGLAFVSDPDAAVDALEFCDSLPATTARRRALLAALAEPSPAVYGRNAARLRVVA